MSHLTTADVLLIGILAHPAISILTWCWQKGAPYVSQFFWVKIESPYELTDWIKENLKPSLSFKSGSVLENDVLSFEPASALFFVNRSPFFFNEESVGNGMTKKYIYLPRWAKFDQVFRSFLENQSVSSIQYKTVYGLYNLHDQSWFPSVSMKKERQHEIVNGFRLKQPEKAKVEYALSPEQLELELDLDHFLKSREEYRKVGIPYRRGYNLWGLPGTGKSAYVKYLAQKYDVPIIQSNLSRSLPGKRYQDCVVFILVDDFDCIFHKREYAKVKSGESKDAPPVSFEDLLNKMSGVDAYENVVWFFTANDVSKIDDAIGVPTTEETFSKTSRPGRLDRALKFGYATQGQKEHICKRVLGEKPSQKDLFEDLTTSAYEERCRTIMLERLFRD